MMNCQQASRLLSDAQERQLSLKERTALKFHLLMCTGCRNFSRQMGTLRYIAHTYTKHSEHEHDADASRSTNDDQNE